MDMSNMMETIIIPWGIKIALALVIFYVGRMVVSAVVGVAQKFMRNREMHYILISFLSSILRWVLLLFVVLADGVELDDSVRARIRSGLREGLSPRHVPDELHHVAAIPTTLSGKKLELPVKKILLGADPDRVASRGSLHDPAALDAIVDLAGERMN